MVSCIFIKFNYSYSYYYLILEHGYIGLSPQRQQEHDTDEPQSSVISPYLKALTDFIIPISRLKLTEILGKGMHMHEPGRQKYNNINTGEFGVVHRGLLVSHKSQNNTKPEPVAVKTLKG